MVSSPIGELDPALLFPLIIWVLAVAFVLFTGWHPRAFTVGLPLAYVLNLSINHWFGGLVYLLPWFANVRDTADTIEGVRESTFAIVAFTVGSIVLAPRLDRMRRPQPGSPLQWSDTALAWAYLGIGACAFLVLGPLLRQIPSLSAVTSVGWNFLVVGLGLGCWAAWHQHRRKLLLVYFPLVVCLPFLTVVAQGFLGFGTVAALSVLAFIATEYRPRWHVLLAGTLAIYFGLSVFTTYARDRSAIRDIVWGGGDLEERLGQVYDTITLFEWFDPTNSDHLRYVDLRLNQNILVGAAVRYLEGGNEEYASGETLGDAALAVVPRILWPDKPVVAGSGNLVARFTGITFGEGTAVGIGNVLEFYANFGTPGVIIGSMLLGLCVGVVDREAARSLLSRHPFRFVRWYLPGICLLNVGGSFVEVTSSAAAALVAVAVAEVIIRKLFERTEVILRKLFERTVDRRARIPASSAPTQR